MLLSCHRGDLGKACRQTTLAREHIAHERMSASRKTASRKNASGMIRCVREALREKVPQPM